MTGQMPETFGRQAEKSCPSLCHVLADPHQVCQHLRVWIKPDIVKTIEAGA